MAVNTSMFVKIGANISDFSKKMTNVQRSLTNVSKKMKSIGSSMTMSVTGPLAAFAAVSVKTFNDQAQAETKLATALKGNETAYASLTQQAKELQKVTLFGDEETMAAQALIAAMVKEEEQILRVMPLVQDFATAKGMDLAGAADLVSKTLGSSTNALSRYGIEVTGAVGSTERLESLTNGLSNAFEGQAEAVAKVGAGPLIQLKNQFGDLMEELGGIVMNFLQPFADWVTKMVTKFQDLDKETKTFIVFLGGLAAVIGPAIYMFGVMAGAIAFLVSPIGIALLALAGFVTVFTYIMYNWDAFIERLSDWSFFKNSLINVLQFIVAQFNKLYSVILDGYNKMMGLFGVEAEENPLTALDGWLEGLKDTEKQYEHQFKSFADTAREGMSDIMGILGIGGEELMPQTGGGGLLGGNGGGTGGTGGNEGGYGEGGTHDFSNVFSLMNDELDELNPKLEQHEDIMSDVMNQMASDLSQGARDFDEYSKNVRKAMRKMISGLISQGVTAAVTNAIKSTALAPPMIPIVAGLAAGLATTAFNTLIPEFGTGGIVTGPTMGIIGEAGPEVIFPLSQLDSFLSSKNTSIIQVEGMLTGNDIFLSNARTNTSLNRITG